MATIRSRSKRIRNVVKEKAKAKTKAAPRRGSKPKSRKVMTDAERKDKLSEKIRKKVMAKKKVASKKSVAKRPTPIAKRSITSPAEVTKSGTVSSNPKFGPAGDTQTRKKGTTIEAKKKPSMYTGKRAANPKPSYHPSGKAMAKAAAKGVARVAGPAALAAGAYEVGNLAKKVAKGPKGGKPSGRNARNKPKAESTVSKGGMTGKTVHAKPAASPTSEKKVGFKSAFASARKAGQKEFTWNGKRYNTKLASDKKTTAEKTFPKGTPTRSKPTTRTGGKRWDGSVDSSRPKKAPYWARGKK